MTNKERLTLLRACKELLQYIETPSVSVSSYEIGDGVLHHAELMSPSEADRLLSSADYKLGWAKCRERVTEATEAITKIIDESWPANPRPRNHR